ncbi:response regulator [Tunturibacter empetritectus]|uniref:Two-component system NarL family response regulator n=1 Tax=Tunturiibacter lichenicola TaxID=2051959 RepID=A0A7W8JBS9_9BACT|nr:response regulator [Edaphobacter lichenicola]MBB5346270.1 two-component system NarL family response regulator [Edaphobacter lichenicola]
MTNAKSIRLLIVDDHPVVRAGLSSMLASYPELNVVGSVSSGGAALVALNKAKIDVVLLDLRMPEMSGLQTLKAFRALTVTPKVIILTSFENDDDIYETVIAGAYGYLLKACSDEEILTAIKMVHRRERYLPDYIVSRLAVCSPRTLLDPGDVELLDLLASGIGDSAVSMRMKLPKKEVQQRFNNILDGLIERNVAMPHKSESGQRVTIEEVARKAGVSMSTVSRVLNNKGNHSEDTKIAVMAVVRKCGFRLNSTAASLAMMRTPPQT